MVDVSLLSNSLNHNNRLLQQVSGDDAFQPRLLIWAVSLKNFISLPSQRKNTLGKISFISVHFQVGFRMVEVAFLSPEGWNSKYLFPNWHKQYPRIRKRWENRAQQ